MRLTAGVNHLLWDLVSWIKQRFLSDVMRVKYRSLLSADYRHRCGLEMLQVQFTVPIIILGGGSST